VSRGGKPFFEHDRKKAGGEMERLKRKERRRSTEGIPEKLRGKTVWRGQGKRFVH